MTDKYDSSQSIIKSLEAKDGVAVLVLQGEVDMSNSPALRAKVLEVFDGSPSVFLIDMTEIGYMDSSGLGTLVEALKWANRKNTKLRLVGANDSVKSVFEISRLTSIFKFCDTQEEALSQD
jgi:anti-sigma B factor antagonist